MQFSIILRTLQKDDGGGVLPLCKEYNQRILRHADRAVKKKGENGHQWESPFNFLPFLSDLLHQNFKDNHGNN